MEYTAENIRYCLLTFDHWQKSFQEQFTKHKPAISGLFQWANVFGGVMDFPRTPEQFSKFNLIHINVTPRNLFLIPQVRPKIDHKTTKLIVNVDYAIDLWLANYNFPELFLQELDRADYVFAVEPQMSEILSMHLKRPVACIPHPSDLYGIGKFATNDRTTTIGVNIHRYDRNLLLPWFALNNLQLDRAKYLTAAMGGCFTPDEVAHLYDMFIEHQPFPEMMKFLAQLLLVIDTFTIRSYGRFSIECATLGIPCIGTYLVDSIHRCFPDLCTEPNDIPKTAKLVNQLINDDDFYTEVANKAQQKVEYYSYDNCRKMMLEFLNTPQ